MTNQTISGEKELRTAKEAMEHIDGILDQYVTKIGLSTNCNLSESEYFMSLSRQDLAKLSAEECGQGAYMLGQMALHIQKQWNIEMARVEWAESRLKEYVAPQAGNYGKFMYEERKMSVIRDNSYAKKLYDISIYAKQRATRISYLAGRLDLMAQSLISLQQTKRRVN